MAEFTKGKLKSSDGFPNILKINGETICCVFPNMCSTAKEILKQKAHIKESLRRWNTQPALLGLCNSLDNWLQ